MLSVKVFPTLQTQVGLDRTLRESSLFDEYLRFLPCQSQRSPAYLTLQ